MKRLTDQWSLNYWAVTSCSEILEQALVDQCSSEYISPLWPNPEQGVYEFPRLTLLGFDTNEPQIRRLSQLGLKVFLFCITPYHLVARINILDRCDWMTKAVTICHCLSLAVTIGHPLDMIQLQCALCRWVTRTAGTRALRLSDPHLSTWAESLPRSLDTGWEMIIISVFDSDFISWYWLKPFWQDAQGCPNRGTR